MIPLGGVTGREGSGEGRASGSVICDEAAIVAERSEGGATAWEAEGRREEG